MAQFFIGSHNDSKVRPTPRNQNHDGSLSSDDDKVQPVDLHRKITLFYSKYLQKVTVGFQAYASLREGIPKRLVGCSMWGAAQQNYG